MKEKTITNNAIKLLRSRGFWVMKIYGNGIQRAGVPDLLAVKDGRAYFFEIKQPGKKPTKLQAYTIEELRVYGATVLVITSIDELREHINNPHFSKPERRNHAY